MNKKIYIADDEPGIREVLKEFLNKAGYETEEFENGESLLKKFSENKPDLLLIDIMMPKVSGFSVCKEVRKESDIPIIMLTARDSDLDKLTALELGTNKYITKPFNGIELITEVSNILSNNENGVQ